jgi:hypothetical protein
VAPKKPMKDLAKKPVSKKKAAAVKGGATSRFRSRAM